METIDSKEKETVDQTAPKAPNRAAEVGAELFKLLLLVAEPKDPETALLTVNSAIFFLCCVQNNLYTYENREKFAEELCAFLKANKGPEPKSPDGQTEGQSTQPEGQQAANLETVQAEKTCP